MTLPNSFTNLIELKERAFTSVFGLWLAPKVGTGASGGYDVETILQADFNYKVIGEFFGGLFGQSAPVQLRVANDHIDVSTFDTRLYEMNHGQRNSEDLFADFGKSLLRNAKNHTDGVIDIRHKKSWSDLKSTAAFQDFVYPPQILPFCVVANKSDDTDWWLLHSLEAIKVSPMENVARRFLGKPAVNREHNNLGVLSPSALEFLGDIYKVWFEPRAMLTLMAAHAS